MLFIMLVTFFSIVQFTSSLYPMFLKSLSSSNVRKFSRGSLYFLCVSIPLLILFSSIYSGSNQLLFHSDFNILTIANRLGSRSNLPHSAGESFTWIIYPCFALPLLSSIGSSVPLLSDVFTNTSTYSLSSTCA